MNEFDNTKYTNYKINQNHDTSAVTTGRKELHKRDNQRTQRSKTQNNDKENIIIKEYVSYVGSFDDGMADTLQFDKESIENWNTMPTKLLATGIHSINNKEYNDGKYVIKSTKRKVPTPRLSKIPAMKLYDELADFNKGRKMIRKKESLPKWLVEKKEMYKTLYNKYQTNLTTELYIQTVSDDMKMKQWGIQTKKLEKDWGQIHNIGIWSIALTRDEEFVFTGDSDGFQKQWDLDSQLQIKDFGKVHDGAIFHILITTDNKTMFTCDKISLSNTKLQNNLDVSTVKPMFTEDKEKDCFEEVDNRFKNKTQNLQDISQTKMNCHTRILDNIKQENLIQWDLVTMTIKKEWGAIHEHSLFSINVSMDSKYMFTGDQCGYMKQWDLKTGNLVKDYGKIHKDSILSTCITPDGKFLFTADRFGYMKQWSISERKLTKFWGDIHSGLILSIAVSPDSKTVQTVDNMGYQMQWSIEDYGLVKEYARAHEGSILRVEVTSCGQYAITIDNKGYMKQWDLNSCCLFKDYGRIHDGSINSCALTYIS